MDKCIKCGYEHFEWEKCLTTFYYKHECSDYEYNKIGAYNFNDAAERFARKYDEDDHCLVGSSEEVVISDGQVEKKFSVSAEQDIIYYADEVSHE